MKKLVIAALFVMGAVAVSAQTANATILGEQSQSQEASQSASATCTSGEYGSNINCHVETSQNVKQEQRQKILGAADVVPGVRGGKVHVPVDTAMDTVTATAALGTTVMGGVAYIIKRKIA